MLNSVSSSSKTDSTERIRDGRREARRAEGGEGKGNRHFENSERHPHGQQRLTRVSSYLL